MGENAGLSAGLRASGFEPGRLPLEAGAHETGKERMRGRRPALELGVELTADEERVVTQLDHFDQALVGRGAAQNQPNQVRVPP
jgi:hypothetical protein